MSWRILVLAAAAAVLPGVAQAQGADGIPVVYQATRLVQGGTTLTVLLPVALDRFDPTRPGEALTRAFDLLRVARQADYGRTSLTLDDPVKPRRVTLQLDPDKKDAWDLIAAEVFHTARSLGVAEVRAPALRDAPLDLATLRVPAFLPVVPFQEALPPRDFPYGAVALTPTEWMPAELFSYRLRSGDRDLTERVLAGLSSPSDAVRLSVLAAIPRLVVDKRAARLLPLLSDKSSAVRLAVLNLLKDDASREVTERLEKVVENDADAQVKLRAVQMLSGRGVKKFDVLIDMDKLQDSSDETVRGAVERLAASGNPMVVPALVQALKHRAPAVRATARDGLLRVGAVDAMVAALPDDGLDLPTRETFARWLAEKGPTGGRPAALAWIVQRGAEPAAVAAAKTLGETRPPEGLIPLYAALLRPEAAIRAATFQAVAAYRDPASIKAVLSAPRTAEDRVLAESAAVAILAAQPLDGLLVQMESPDVATRKLAMKAFGDSLKGSAPPPQAVRVLQTRASDPDLGVRRAAVYALARIPDDAVTATVMGRAGDPDPEIREAAVVAATRSRDPAAEAVLVKALNDDSDKVRGAALDGVAAKRIKSARESLQMMLEYQDATVRRKAAAAWLALVEPGEEASQFDTLSRMLYDNDPEVKLAALKVVARVKERKAIMAMSALVIHPVREVKLAALDQLALTGEKDALEGIQRAVFDTDDVVRLAALDSMGKLGLKESVDFLGELLGQESDAKIRARAEQIRQALLNR